MRASRRLPVHRLVSPLIGREPQMSALADAFADASSGVQRTLLISAEAGGGKTRLIREATQRLFRGATCARRAGPVPRCSPAVEQEPAESRHARQAVERGARTRRVRGPKSALRRWLHSASRSRSAAAGDHSAVTSTCVSVSSLAGAPMNARSMAPVPPFNATQLPQPHKRRHRSACAARALPSGRPEAHGPRAARAPRLRARAVIRTRRPAAPRAAPPPGR